MADELDRDVVADQPLEARVEAFNALNWFLPVSGEFKVGGRYALDTAKSADLGGAPDALIVDLNFLYHPSCRYDSAWQCPLAPQGNRIDAVVNAGERL